MCWLFGCFLLSSDERLGEGEEGLEGWVLMEESSWGREVRRLTYRSARWVLTKLNFIFGLSPCEIAEVPRGVLGANMPRLHDAIKTRMYVEIWNTLVQPSKFNLSFIFVVLIGLFGQPKYHFGIKTHPQIFGSVKHLKTIGRCFWIILVLFLFLLEKTVQIRCKQSPK